VKFSGKTEVSKAQQASFSTQLGQAHKFPLPPQYPFSHLLTVPRKNPVLVLAGIELIVFVAAGMRLCFGFLQKTLLTTQGCFSHCWAVLTHSQGLFCSSPCPTSERAGGAQETTWQEDVVRQGLVSSPR